MKLSDKVWMWSNKKPPKPLQSYFQLVFLWSIYGGLISVALFMWLLFPKNWYISIPIVVLCLCMMVWFAVWDMKAGVVGALHEHWTQKWLARKEKIERDSSKGN